MGGGGPAGSGDEVSRTVVFVRRATLAETIGVVSFMACGPDQANVQHCDNRAVRELFRPRLHPKRFDWPPLSDAVSFPLFSSAGESREMSLL